MLRGGTQLKDHLKMIGIKEVMRQKDKVLNQIKQDAFERIITLANKIRRRLQTGEQKRSIAKTPSTEESHDVRSLVKRKNDSSKASESYKFDEDDKVMLIGGYVHHLAQSSVAAVVGSVDWPVSNAYGAMIRRQTHGQETIQKFGEACVDLIDAYVEVSKKRPKKIVVFRYAVTTEVVLEEMVDLRQRLLDEGDYKPEIMVIVATKRTSCPAFEERNDSVDFYFPRWVQFDFEIVYGHGILSLPNLLSYFCYQEATVQTTTPLITFKMVPPIIFAHLAAVRDDIENAISDEWWMRGNPVHA